MATWNELLAEHYLTISEKATRTGFKELDAAGGFPKSKLIVVTGRPSCGKTSFALSVAYKAIKDDRKIVILSQQMTEPEIWCRFVSFESGVPAQVVMYDPTWIEANKKAFDETVALLEGKDFRYVPNSTVLGYIAPALNSIDGIVIDSYQMINDYDFIHRLYQQSKKDGFWIMVVSDTEDNGIRFTSKMELLKKDRLFQLADMVIKVDNAPTDISLFGGGDPLGRGVIEIVKSRHTREFDFLCDYDHMTNRLVESRTIKRQEA